MVAYETAKRSGLPTLIKMDFGSLKVIPGKQPSFEVTSGHYRDSIKNSVRRAKILASDIGPVAVTKSGKSVGVVTKDAASEALVLRKLR